MKPLYFIGSSRDDLRKFPDEAKSEAGFAIYLAQMGEKAANAFPLVGYGGVKVIEVIINEDGNAYRAVYTVKFKNAVYVLHAFQKKSKKGISTPKPVLALINARLKLAEAHHTELDDHERKKR